MTKSLQIAIDGPVGAGKSTLAKILAERLGITYIYTGAMYRAVALAARERKVVWEDEKAVKKVAEVVRIDLKKPPAGDKRMVKVFLDGQEVTNQVFTEEMGEGASVVSQYLGVRAVLVEKQRQLAKSKAVVMDGRDIGTNVLPQASLKIYLDADLDERVRRKQKQMQISQTQAQKDILTRDRREMSRENNPLRPAKDAWVLDTTEMTVGEVADRILRKIRDLGYR